MDRKDVGLELTLAHDVERASLKNESRKQKQSEDDGKEPWHHDVGPSASYACGFC